ncbi:MAG: DUF2905 domain-containing protein [Synergistaceae bacterium]|jgi:hypothetical protein|nr:DUF2905 domain-containing protein [Synergistaceae bacterium]
MNGLARFLMVSGIAIFAVGLLVYLASKSGLPFGRLPGDISWSGKSVKVFAPITSMIVVSLILTVILNLVSKFGGK